MQPLVEAIQTDLTAHEAFCCFQRQASVAFLESRPGYGQAGRYSILGINPYQSLQYWPNHCLLDGETIQEDVFLVLDRLLAADRTESIPGLPLVGGCIGFIAYDAGFDLLGLPLPERVVQAADCSRPLVSFDFYDNFLIFDHKTGQVLALACGRLEPAENSLAKLRDCLKRSFTYVFSDSATAETGPVPGQKAVSLPDRDSYLARVEAIRELIRLGEVYIANLTHQLTANTAESAETLYARLRQLNPAPFSAFLRQGNVEILSASPERFIQIRPADIRTSDQQIRSQGSLLPRTITTYPIKGTRPRGEDAASDAQNASDLLASGKDRSELLMIVDLERNDLSRICLPDSIVVPELFRLETYPTVHHLVATVQGLLREQISAVDALKACFPGGSITGAPKIAAMRIIDQLEQQARYLYTGCLGYFSLDGQADFNILIRSIIKQGQSVSYGSGGGITWESHAVDEYDEMLVKAKSFRQVMQKESQGEAFGNAMD